MEAQKEWEDEIREAARKVYAALGPSLPENLYRNAMIVELGCNASRAVAINIFYDGVLAGTVEADIVSFDPPYVLELKTIISAPVEDGKEVGQCKAYMRHLDIEKGATINFGWVRNDPDIVFIYS